MAVRRDPFVMDIYHEGKPYTPQGVIDYIAATTGEGFADQEKVERLILDSHSKLMGILKDNKIDPSQTMRKSDSDIAQQIAQLALDHCDSTISLMHEGAWNQGVFL